MEGKGYDSNKNEYEDAEKIYLGLRELIEKNIGDKKFNKEQINAIF